jgi:uncharacterized membrane protein YoaT (DUF817 family)
MEKATVSPAVALAFFAIGTFLMALLYHTELLLLAVIIVFTIVHLAYGKWTKVKRFLLAMVVGGACENMAVMLGAWGYSNAHYLPVPLWLPVGWGLAALLLDEALPGAERLHFSWKALAAALAGTFMLGFIFGSELLTLLAFTAAIAGFFLFEHLKKEELAAGLAAAALGTAMESINILAGNWHYTVAKFGTPLWLPLCWFAAFLIMRRVMRFGEKF